MMPAVTTRYGLAMILGATAIVALGNPTCAQDFPSGNWKGAGGVTAPPADDEPAARPSTPAERAPAPPAENDSPPQQKAPTPKPKPTASKPKPGKTAINKDGDSGGARRSRGGDDSARIVMKVNDEPITAREISQRQRIMGGGDISDKVRANMQRLIKSPDTTARLKAILGEIVKANEGKSKDEIIAIFENRKKQFAMSLQKQAVESARASVSPAVRKEAIEALIEDRLKLQAAKATNITVNEDDVNKQVALIATRNKMTTEQFEQHLKSTGIDVNTMKSRTRAEMAWIETVRRKFGHQIAITSRDVDRLVSAGPAAEDGVELQIQRVSLQLLNKVDQKALAQRQLEAEAARANFQGCKNTAALANTVPGARFDDLGGKMPTSIPEPTRSLLLAAQDGEMLPPSLGPTGIELWVLCSRKTVAADTQKRAAAEDEAKQQEFQILAKKYLRDLRTDAVIDDLDAGGS